MSLLLCPLLSVFFYFDVSPHFSPPNGLEMSQNGPWRFNHCDSNVMVLKSQNDSWRFKHCDSNVMVLKEVKTVHGGYYPLCMSQVVLEAGNSVCIHNGLEMSQF